MKKIWISFFMTFLLASCMNKVDERGFYLDGKHAGLNKITKNIYDKEGYDIKGYNKYGFDRSGYDKMGFNSLGYDKNGINRRGYDENGVYHNEYLFNRMMTEEGIGYQKAKEYMAKRYSLKNTYIYSAGKGEFETTKEYMKRLEADQKKYLNYLVDSYFMYDDGRMDIKYNADTQEMIFTVYSYEESENITGSDGKIERKIRHFSLPFKSREEYRLKMTVEEAKNFDKSKIKIKMILSPTYEAILGDTRFIKEYGLKEKEERNIDYDRKTDDYRSIIGYRIYDDSRVYYENMMDIKMREGFMKYAETLIDARNVQQRYPARVYIKNGNLHFVREEYVENSYKNRFIRYVYDFKTKKITKDRKLENYTSFEVKKLYRGCERF